MMQCNPKSNRIQHPFSDLQVGVDSLFDHLFNGQGARSSTGWTPRVSIAESDVEYQLVMEFPGLNPEDVSVEVKDGLLEISGSKKQEELADGFRILRDERTGGEFERKFEFSTQVDFEKVEATFNHGLLTLSLPKSEKVLPRKIEISVGE
ncbi:MAG: Hsp20/alpha crystallin family protein [Planctomycetota bacterium]